MKWHITRVRESQILGGICLAERILHESFEFGQKKKVVWRRGRQKTKRKMHRKSAVGTTSLSTKFFPEFLTLPRGNMFLWYAQELAWATELAPSSKIKKCVVLRAAFCEVGKVPRPSEWPLSFLLALQNFSCCTLLMCTIQARGSVRQ